jgi:hypothetical protein
MPQKGSRRWSTLEDDRDDSGDSFADDAPRAKRTDKPMADAADYASGSAGEGPVKTRVCPPPYKKPTVESRKELEALFSYTIQVGVGLYPIR